MKDEEPDIGQENDRKQTQKERLYTNRLIHEKSPYLQQHAHNPVD